MMFKSSTEILKVLKKKMFDEMNPLSLYESIECYKALIK
jgi:hypothetical protein